MTWFRMVPCSAISPNLSSKGVGPTIPLSTQQKPDYPIIIDDMHGVTISVASKTGQWNPLLFSINLRVYHNSG